MSRNIPDPALAVELETRRRQAEDKNATQRRNDPLPTAAEIEGLYGDFYRAITAGGRT